MRRHVYPRPSVPALSLAAGREEKEGGGKGDVRGRERAPISGDEM